MLVPRADFNLSPDFISQFAGRQPRWGELGYLVYKRTYAADKPDGTSEEYWETCQRVVEGVYQIQRGHCQRYNLPWCDAKAQGSAQEMYSRMFAFKFLPAGRGLAKMGTDVLFRIGGACLNSCGFVTTRDIGNANIKNAFSSPFVWLMNMSMVGVGVGFDTLGAATNTLILKPSYSAPHLVADSREGWCEYLRLLLQSLVDPTVPMPLANYSQVRPSGAPIKGFGGTASGPEALENLTNRLLKLASIYENKTVDSRFIVDVANSVGECVVAGGTRRTAEIAFGTPGDSAFLQLKNYETNPEATEWPRWCSNNSFVVNAATDFSAMAKATATVGEPGYFFLENAQQYGRMKDPPSNADAQVMGANPCCFTGSTRVAVADGRHTVTLTELASSGNDVAVYSLNPVTNKMSIKWGRAPRLTRRDAKLVRVHLENGGHLDCTPDHQWLLKNGSKKAAEDLQAGDSLSSFTKHQKPMKKGGKKYWLTTLNTNQPLGKGSRVFEHKLIAQFFMQKEYDRIYAVGAQSGWCKGGVVIHHENYNPLDNRPANLTCMPFKDHAAYHAQHDCQGVNNGMYGKKHSEETKQKIGAKARERWRDSEFREKWSQSCTPAHRAKHSVTLSTTRNSLNLEYWLAQEAITDLNTVWIEGRLYARKTCEQCFTEFTVAWGKRHRSYCSMSCNQEVLAVSEKRKTAQRQYFVTRQQTTLHDQVMVYKDLEATHKRLPFKKEWEQACVVQGVPRRFRTPNSSTDNPYALLGFKHLKTVAKDYNDRVVRVEELEHTENVYCMTVADNHTFAVIPEGRDTTKSLKALNVSNCEQSLENYETCCLVETFPSKNDTYEDYERTLKCAYLYAKTVTLVPTQSPETNAVMLRNRRIGCSQSGIQDNIEMRGLHSHLQWCDQGYQYIQKLDQVYSDWLCVPRSRKTTSVKPSGTASKLVGVREGIHESKGEYELQTIRLHENSPLILRLKQANYRVEKATSEPNTAVAYFPMHYSRSRPCNPTMWEQLELAALMQYYWADNQVSVTVDFNPNTEGPEIKRALEMYAHRLKGVSFLPRKDLSHFAQLPKTVITKEEYEEYKATLLPLNLSNLSTHEVDDKFCSGDTCVLPGSPLDTAKK